MVAGGAREGVAALRRQVRALTGEYYKYYPHFGQAIRKGRLLFAGTDGNDLEYEVRSMGIGCEMCPMEFSMDTAPERRRRIGLLGGTFNPVHVGHIALGVQAKREFALDGVTYIPVGLPPHKRDEFVADAQDRFAMLRLAVEGQRGLFVSRIELDRQGYTYTVDTLTDLRRLCPDDEFFFIIGADTLFEVQTWKSVAEVFSLCQFIVFYRPGHRLVSMLEEADRLKDAYGARMLFAEFRGPDVSSTLIRDKLARGESAGEMLPPSVERYILENGVYR